SDDEPIRGTLESAFRIRALSLATEQTAAYALVASGEAAAEREEPRPVRTALEATQRATVEHTSPRDVWFRNSLRGAAGLAIAFGAGQAGFTVVLFVLFNIIQPTGWRVGLVRIEDVAIGFAVSLGVGLLFWPRGVAALLRENLAFSYARNADYVVAAERELVD